MKTIKVHINRQSYEFNTATQTGQSLKERAGIPLTDVLFHKQHPKDDEIVNNDATICLHEGDHFYSQPAADYGDDDSNWPAGGKLVPQANNWQFLIIENFAIPEAYSSRQVKLLIKIPPLFPDAQPDMFWVHPAITLLNGGAPRGTGTENLMNESWQSFSWHLAPGAWKPGVSDIWDYIRCVRARFERRD